MNFQQSPWGCFRKRGGGSLINAGPPEALSLKTFFRQHPNVCIILRSSLVNTSLNSSVRVGTVCKGMKKDDSLCLLVYNLTVVTLELEWIFIWVNCLLFECKIPHGGKMRTLWKIYQWIWWDFTLYHYFNYIDVYLFDSFKNIKSIHCLSTY